MKKLIDLTIFIFIIIFLILFTMIINNDELIQEKGVWISLTSIFISILNMIVIKCNVKNVELR
jgi:ABC-type Na+ efflux pump permease subunit